MRLPRTLRGIFAFVLGAGLTAVAAADTGLTLDQVLTHIQHRQTSTTALRFAFQETLRQGSESQTLSGRVHFERPHHILVEQSRPEKQMLWSDGIRFSLYTPSAEQVLEGSWSSWVKQTGFPEVLLSFISDFPVSEWSTHYHVLFGGHDQGEYKILLKPLTNHDSPVTVWVSDKTFLPERGQTKTALADVTITFKDYDMSPSGSDDWWTAHVPSDTAHVALPS